MIFVKKKIQIRRFHELVKFNFRLKKPLSNFSALRIHGKSATFRQHYYPEGGWGWVITFCCFLVNIFTTGLQLSFSVLSLEIIRLCGTVCREDKISVGELPALYHGAASKLAAQASCLLYTGHVSQQFFSSPLKRRVLIIVR